MSDATLQAPPTDLSELLEGCGVIDRSERGKLALGGPDATEFLNGQVTNELLGLAPGEGRYAAFLTHKGKMLGDLRILHAADPVDGGAPALLLDTERCALQALFDMIRRFKVGYDIDLHKRTLERGLISLIGPLSGRVAEAAELAAEEHSSIAVRIGGLAALAIRTDLGVDLWCDSADTEALMREIHARGGHLASRQADECRRIETGRPRFGIDIDEGVIPQEAGLNERAVSFTKGCYVGQETVARLFYKGRPNRNLRGLRLSAPVRAPAELLLDGRAVGSITSAALSPGLGPIGLGLVRREAPPGTVLAAGAGDVSAEVLELPF